MRLVHGTATAVAVVAIAAWTLTTGASYTLVSHIVHIRAVTSVQTNRPEVGILVDAPIAEVPSLARTFASDRICVTFGLDRPSRTAVRSIVYYGDRAIPRLSGGGLVRWLETGDQLHSLVRPFGFQPHRFVYASSGPSIGQWWLAHQAGGRLVAGAVLIDDRGDGRQLHAGEVVELRISRTSQVTTAIAQLRRELRADSLRGVPVSRLMRDGGVSV
jgi:hypothetical protein